MSRFEYGPLDTYEIVWTSGHVEYIQAHQVILPPDDSVADAFFPGSVATRRRDGWMFHGQIDGRWKLLLFAPAEDITSVRNVTHTRDEVA